MPTPLERFFEAAGCRTQTELAEFLGIRQSSISDAKKRGSIPPDWLLLLWRKKGINPDWILTGQGSKGLQSVDLPEPSPIVNTVEVRPPGECSVEELLATIIQRILNSANKI